MLNAVVLISDQNDPERCVFRGLRGEFPDVNWQRGSTLAEIGPQVENADVVFAFAQSITDELLIRARRLRWLQLLGSGSDGLTQRRTLQASTLVTSGHGAQAVPVAEAVLGFMLSLARNLPELTRNQARREWRRWPARLLDGSSAVIAGVGTIAAALAPRCAALGIRVCGISETPRTLPGFAEILPRDALPRAAASADYLIVLCALTPTTRNLIDAEVFAAMKPTAFLINAARGPVVRQADLIDALSRGQIAGAALDVFDEEPLPRDSPLWETPGLLISPHIAGLNDRYWHDLLPLLVENMRAFLQGRAASLRNSVPR